ncbi:MAG: hypothetical protein AB7K24_23160, partial [Gemmataceae bacterium]
MHRQEYELEMLRELNKFTETLQGSLSRSDQAYLANAMSLGLAVSGQGARRRTELSQTTEVTAIPTPDADVTATMISDFDKVITRNPPHKYVELSRF